MPLSSVYNKLHSYAAATSCWIVLHAPLLR
jgi:hypothetical protein